MFDPIVSPNWMTYWATGKASLYEGRSYPTSTYAMLPLAETTFWVLTALVEVFVVFLFLNQGLFRNFALLNIYLLFSAAIGLGRLVVFHAFGWDSSEYL